jgi:hypothetical protein
LRRYNQVLSSDRSLVALPATSIPVKLVVGDEDVKALILVKKVFEVGRMVPVDPRLTPV